MKRMEDIEKGLEGFDPHAAVEMERVSKLRDEQHSKFKEEFETILDQVAKHKT